LGGPEARVRNARLSFYSGHASTAMNVAVFCVMYLQARLPRRIYGISLLPLFQTMLIGGALLVGYSRVSDNMHHPTDVMVGFAAGLMVALVSAKSILVYVGGPVGCRFVADGAVGVVVIRPLRVLASRPYPSCIWGVVDLPKAIHFAQLFRRRNVVYHSDDELIPFAAAESGQVIRTMG
uniref:AcidPPc domain-containing protein n=1 Tax=Anisakis simplex TaxID=6269 RepID=A0A0M3J775_ANISI